MRRLAYLGTLVTTSVLGVLILAIVGGTAVGVKPHVAILTCLAVGLLPVVAVWLSIFSPQRAAHLHALTIPPAILSIVLYPREFGGFAGSFLVFLGVSVVPTLYWRIQLKRISTTAPIPLGAPRRGWAMCVVAGLCCLSVLLAFVLALFLPWWYPVGDCGGGPLVDGSGRPVGLDFTGEVIFVGPESYQGYSLWAVVRLKENFSASKWQPGKLVIAREFWRATANRKNFFVEGEPSDGALMQFLPVIQRMECGHTDSLDHAKASIDLLHNRPRIN